MDTVGMALLFLQGLTRKNSDPLFIIKETKRGGKSQNGKLAIWVLRYLGHCNSRLMIYI